MEVQMNGIQNIEVKKRSNGNVKHQEVSSLFGDSSFRSTHLKERGHRLMDRKL